MGLISRGNIQIHHRYRCQSVGISISYLHLTSRLNSKWLDLILALNHFSRQSAATSSSKLNISDIAISFFFFVNRMCTIFRLLYLFSGDEFELITCQIAQIVQFLERMAKTTFDNDAIDLWQVWMKDKNNNIQNSIQISVFGSRHVSVGAVVSISILATSGISPLYFEFSTNVKRLPVLKL